VKDAMSRMANYGYDALGRQISISNPAIKSSPLLQKTYTLDGLVASLTDANSNTTNFASDGFDRLATSRVHRTSPLAPENGPETSRAYLFCR
jgi:hypothetical protein